MNEFKKLKEENNVKKNDLNGTGNSKLENFVNLIFQENNTEEIKSNDVYEYIKEYFTFYFYPKKIKKYIITDKKIVKNSLGNLDVMKKLCIDLCKQNIKVYQKWCETFCKHDEVKFKEELEGKLGDLKKVTLFELEKYLLPSGCDSKKKLDSLIGNNNINDNSHRSINILRFIFKKIKKINKKKEDTASAEENTKIVYNEHFCIIASEFCRNIRQVLSMLPSQDINKYDYDASLKKLVKDTSNTSNTVNTSNTSNTVNTSNTRNISEEPYMKLIMKIIE